MSLRKFATNPMDMDVVTFGETMVLFVPQTNGPLRFVSNFNKTIGGAESNVAIALSRLGHKVGWMSRLGDDEFGLYIRNTIRGEGVDTSHVIFDSDHDTAVFFKERPNSGDPKVYYYRKNSAASALCSSDIKNEFIKNATYLHITGITAAISETARDAIHSAITIAREHGVKVVFDPNIRLKLWNKEKARDKLMKIARRSDIVLPGIDEGEILTGEHTPVNIAKKLLNETCQTVIIKLGEKGAYFASNTFSEYVPGYEVEKIVDTVGAGDGFAAGFISGQLRGMNVLDSVRLGNKIGASALTTQGDTDGYPSWEEINSNNIKVRR